MVVATIKRKRGGLSTYSYLIQTVASSIRRSDGISVCSTHESFFRSKYKVMNQNRFSIRSSIVHKNLYKNGDQIILMGGINEYIIIKKSGHSLTN